jgi:hypothetical protein
MCGLYGWQTEEVEKALELVHGDLYGPISPTTASRNAYFLLLIDDRSGYMWTSLLVTKDQVVVAIREF